MRATFAVFAGALVLLAALTGARAAPPHEPDPGARVSALARSLMSPFCPGRTLQACPSPEAARWLGEIRTWAAEGRSDPEIVQLLQARVPDFDLDGQPPSATGWLIGLAPIGAASLVLCLIALRAASRRRRHRTHAAIPPDDVDPALDEALDEELDRLD